MRCPLEMDSPSPSTRWKISTESESELVPSPAPVASRLQRFALSFCGRRGTPGGAGPLIFWSTARGHEAHAPYPYGVRRRAAHARWALFRSAGPRTAAPAGLQLPCRKRHTATATATATATCNAVPSPLTSAPSASATCGQWPGRSPHWPTAGTGRAGGEWKPGTGTERERCTQVTVGRRQRASAPTGAATCVL